MTLIVSVYPGPHDAAICILKEGEVLLNLELERFSRVKKEGGMSTDFFNYCLEICDVRDDDIEAFVVDGQYFDLPTSKISELLTDIEGVPIGKFSELRSTLLHSGSAKYKGRKIPFFSVHHHLAHAACAYYTAPFDDTAIITADSGGTGLNFSISVGSNGKISPLPEWYRWTGSLGYWWAKLPSYYGVTEPGTLMAISAYGEQNPNLRAELYSQLVLNSHRPLDQHFVHLGRSCIERDGTPVEVLDPAKKGEADLAFALQSITDEIFAGWFAQAQKITGKSNICFSGGLALNCIGNARAIRLSEAGTLHVPPNANDSGLAMGAALAIYYTIEGKKYTPKHFSPYCGPLYSTNSVTTVIDEACKEHGLARLKVNNLSDTVSDILASKRIMCRFRGRSEAGPRALGNRSFMASPDIKNLRKIMNKVKKREWYRPFAPIVLGDRKDDIFEYSINNSYYMNTSSIVRDEWRDLMAGVLHSDNTTRPQIIDENTESELVEIVQKFYEKSGIPAVLNTSFNINEPLVETPREAINTFLAAGKEVEFLQLEDEILQKI